MAASVCDKATASRAALTSAGVGAAIRSWRASIRIEGGSVFSEDIDRTLFLSAVKTEYTHCVHLANKIDGYTELAITLKGSHMRLFRAIKESAVPGSDIPQGRQESVRLPSNVPYIVDNLWELLRPEHMPSRRHAIYASPTKARALANASSAAEDERHVGCMLFLTGEFKTAQLQVGDARVHGDLRRVSRVVQQHSAYLTGMDTATRAQTLGPLFFPGAGKAELYDWYRDAKARRDTKLVDFADDLMSACTFWKDAVSDPVDSSGELFFELMPGATYHLEALPD